MAIGMITRLPEGVGAAQYDAVTGSIGIAQDPPDGLIFHSAGELEGRFQIFNVWESREQADRYNDLFDPGRSAASREYLAEHEPGRYSMLHTSISPNIINAGYQINVIPSQAEASLDVRRQSGLAETIAQRAVMLIARAAAQRG